MDKLLSKWYGDEMIYSDFKEETLEFLQTLQESISSPADGLRKLTTAFRDPLGSSSILFYFRVSVMVHLARIQRIIYLSYVFR